MAETVVLEGNVPVRKLLYREFERVELLDPQGNLESRLIVPDQGDVPGDQGTVLNPSENRIYSVLRERNELRFTMGNTTSTSEHQQPYGNHSGGSILHDHGVANSCRRRFPSSREEKIR